MARDALYYQHKYKDLDGTYKPCDRLAVRPLLSRLSKRFGAIKAGTRKTPTDRAIRQDNAERIALMERRLVLKRRWAYLRYLHTRRALLQTEGVESVLVIGSGHGYAEITLALEFPGIHFHLTDIVTETTPNYHNAQKFVNEWGISNVTFGLRNILKPEPGRYDLVLSVEVLEHIENVTLAAAEMRAAANRYVFALVPFADKVTNADEDRRARLLKSHGHFVVGYDEGDLRTLFPDIVAMSGCYWEERGGAHRKRLYDMSNREINAHMGELQTEASQDLIDAVPRIYPEAQGIWLLARV